MATKLACVKCGREKAETEFFKMRDGSRCDMCKPCLTEHIDNQKPETFLWILEKFDVPYIETQWISLCNKRFEKEGPAKFGPSSVIGFYLRNMNMAQYRDYTYADSDKLNFAEEKKREEAAKRRQFNMDEKYEEDLKQKLENGEISQAEYDTLTGTNFEEQALPQYTMPKYQVNEEDILEQLDDEERMYLIAKWGSMYRPSEWMKMEQMYRQYEEAYDLNVDRQETLKKICKVSLKLDAAIDSNDYQTAKNYNTILDNLRKSAKFTEAQNKEEKEKELDTIGELVALCERDGGIIEQFPINPDEYPQDKIDFTIKDLKAYNYNLVVKEMGLGDLIESYIAKLEEAEKSDEDMFDELVTSIDQEEEKALDLEALEFEESLENEIEDEALKLLEELGDE